MSEQMFEKLVFNPDGDDRLENRTIIKGNVTNTFNLNETKYNWAKKLYREMLGNFWIPEKIDLTQDKSDYRDKLNKTEKDIMGSILSFLTFLDSIQTTNLTKVVDYITAPEVSTVIQIQDFQEVIHSVSYAYIIESIISNQEREGIYEKWKQSTILFERNKYIASIYQDFWNDRSEDNFIKTLIANYILESLYFYNGFIFFYNLASRNLMLGVADLIRYINTDELSHITLFANIIQTIKHEFPNMIKDELIYEMFKTACEEEIKWSNYILKDSDIIGMNEINTKLYTEFLVNDRLRRIGLEPLFLDSNTNPYKSLELQADGNSDSVKSNFFESSNTNYSMSSVMKGWDKI